VIAIGLLALIVVPYPRMAIRFAGLPLPAVGTAFQAAAIAASGLHQTYYGAEFGVLPDSRSQPLPTVGSRIGWHGQGRTLRQTGVTRLDRDRSVA
jgi:hypothetical protein